MTPLYMGVQKIEKPKALAKYLNNMAKELGARSVKPS